MAESEVIRYMDDDDDDDENHEDERNNGYATSAAVAAAGGGAVPVREAGWTGGAVTRDAVDDGGRSYSRRHPPPLAPFDSLDVRLNGDNSVQDVGGSLHHITDEYGEPLKAPPLVGRLLSSLSLQEDTTQDVLGMLSQTPDIYLHDADDLGLTGRPAGAGPRAWSGRYHEARVRELMPDVYLRDTPVRLTLLQLEPVPATLHIFNQYKVVLQLQHGSFQWQVHTRLKNITSLHNKLALYRLKLRVPAATQKTREKRQSLRHQLQHSAVPATSPQAVEGEKGGMGLAPHNGSLSSGGEEGGAEHRLSRLSTASDTHRRAVKFPRKALSRMDGSSADELQHYLRNLMLHPLFRSHRDVLALFEISMLSFVPGLGCKLKEGYVRKRAGGYSANAGCCSFLCCQVCESCTGQYQERWLVLRETFLFYLAPSSGRVRGVLLMDQDFQVSNGFRHTGINNGLVLTSLSRRLVLTCDSDQVEKDWAAEIRRVQQQHASDFCSRSNRHNSFAPVRQDAMANWYVDGNRYMWDVADAIDSAQEEVFITDWWLSPDIYMKRPDLTAIQWKLSEVLRRAAARGVQVYVLLYKEVELALGLNSLYTKHVLDRMHPNIKVLRHPDHGGGGTLYWAHHEKLVVVDQQLAFVSGIDLCYGRWDDYRHRLVDLGHGGRQKVENAPPTSGAVTPSSKKRELRSSQSSIAQLVMGTQLLINTVQTTSPISTAPTSPTLSPHSPPPAPLPQDSVSATHYREQVSTKLTLESPLESSTPYGLLSGNQAATSASLSTTAEVSTSTDLNSLSAIHHPTAAAVATGIDVPDGHCIVRTQQTVVQQQTTVTSSSAVTLTRPVSERDLGRSAESVGLDGTFDSTAAALDTNRTLTTDLEASVESGSLANSLHDIPAIVEEEVMSRRKSLKTALSSSEDYDGESETNATSDDELIDDETFGRRPSKSDATDTSTQRGKKRLPNRLRSASDPVSKNKTLAGLLSLGRADRRKKPKVEVCRQRSLELLTEGSNGSGGSERRRRRRADGVKSDGDDLSGDEMRRRGSDGGKRERGRDEGEAVDTRHRLQAEQGSPGGARRLEAMQNRSRHLVGGIRSKGSDVKNWTRKKMSALNRADSINSETDLESTTRKSASKWRSRVAAARMGRPRQQTRPDSVASSSITALQNHAPTLYDSPSIHLWVGKDYVNWITKDLNNPDEPFSDSVERNRTPRMPWHDIGLCVEGAAARDVARHFVQRWNAVKNEKVKSNEKYPFLLPRTYDPASFSPSILQYKQRVKCQVLRSVGDWSSGQHEAERSIYNAYHAAIREAKHYIYLENQFFISLSSGTARGDVQNRVAAAIVERIVRAHRTGSVFRVMVLLPLLPAFEGQIGTPSGTAMQFILHYTLSTISRGENSLVHSLESRGVTDWQRYLSFSSLRTHDSLDGQRLVTELVYIHSKLLIVDDRLVIAGSANINDRSLLGERDSEVALIIEDEEFEDGLMNGAPYKRGLFAGSLRRYLVSEHLGLIEPSPPQGEGVFSPTPPPPPATPSAAAADDAADSAAGRATMSLLRTAVNAFASRTNFSYTVSSADQPQQPPATSCGVDGDHSPRRVTLDDIVDPVCDRFYNEVWLATAANNTRIYEEVFQCYPSDRAQTFEAVEKLRSAVTLAASNPTLAAATLAGVQGHLVQFPLHFLAKEALKPGRGTKEGLLPTEMWT